MAYIEFNGVSVGFGSGAARTEVLRDIDLHIEQGEIVALLGFSGSGKTTLVNLLAGLLKPDQGEVLVGGEPVTGPAPDRGLVFQNYSLLPWFDVRKNVALSVNRVFGGEASSARKTRVKEAVEMVNLSPALHKRPGELSGGMRQRVSVARTLAMNPDLLLLDEPLSALDALTRSVIQDEILGIQQQLGQTVILVTNDVDEGLYMADRVIPLSMGPAATLGPVVANPLPAPRSREDLASDPAVAEARTRVISFLLDERARREAEAGDAEITLPDVKPIDISRHKPNLVFSRWRKKPIFRPRTAEDDAEDDPTSENGTEKEEAA